MDNDRVKYGIRMTDVLSLKDTKTGPEGPAGAVNEHGFGSDSDSTSLKDGIK